MRKGLKIILSLLFLGVFIDTSRAQSGIRVTPGTFDYGVVQKWKNDTAYFAIENTGSTRFIFLPVAYSEDLLVMLPHGAVMPGQTVTAKLVYFTHDRGNFRREVPIYINTAGNPVNLTIKGKIVDFHPDAMMSCPSLIEDKPVEPALKPVEIRVVDAITGKGLSGFNMMVQGKEHTQLFEFVRSDKVVIDGMPNGKYQVRTTLEGYEIKQEELLVTRNTRKFVIRLSPQEDVVAMTETTVDTVSPEPVTIKPDETPDEEQKDIEKLRERFDKQFRDKKVIEKDVILVKEGEKDSMSVDTGAVENDFSSTGELNSRKYAKNNIVFLIDVSGSMDKPEKLPYLKTAVREMIKVLRHEDRVTIIVYSGKVNILLQGVTGDEKTVLNGVIDGLTAKGNSYGSEGLAIAYENARQHYISGGNNQVILVSDGIFNSEDFSPKKLCKLARQQADSYGILTSAIGFGKNEDAITFMKNLSENGRGSFIKIRNEEEAAGALVLEIMKNSRMP